ncbi:MAG: heme ABC exporter ATP-binding protein CcmA [Afipia sp.]|nr:heme ABC exporter ATP-binding protein CcmA [Afipia sp.]
MRLLARNVRCVRGGREIFSGLNFEVSPGHALAVTGVNGAGKSSLLRMIVGLLPMADGNISVAGGDRELSLAEQAHYIGHRDAVKPALTVAENLDFWRDFLSGSASSAENSLEIVGLAHAAHLPASVLSAGQKRRLSIARLLTVQRPLWLLDEPTSALDSAGQKTFADLMKSHLKSGGLIVAATHGPLGIAAKQLRIGAAK